MCELHLFLIIAVAVLATAIKRTNKEKTNTNYRCRNSKLVSKKISSGTV